MDMPNPTAEHRRLEKLAGIRRGTEKMHPSQRDPKGGVAQAITRGRVVVGGYAVAGDYEQRSGARVTFGGARGVHLGCPGEPGRAGWKPMMDGTYQRES